MKNTKKVKKAENLKAQKAPKTEKVDGLGKKDILKIRSAIRQVWHRSHPRKLCVQRAVGKNGFLFCEKCTKRVPKIYVDHKQKVGDIDGGFIHRLFCPSTELQALCKKCHDAKTKQERQDAAWEKVIGVE